MLQKYHVAAGTFTVEGQGPLILHAFLGTCVGVALYDAKARIGGLIHLLLPEPPSSDSTYHLEQYASTGLPLFIKVLLDRGASLENLEACIAGGALMGPLSRQDIFFDIGGRTADVANTLLTQKGIKIKNSESGGWFNCALNLDLETFETSIVPLTDKPPLPTFKLPLPTRSELSAALDHLQPIPQVALKILGLLNEDEYDITLISHEIRQDQVLAAKMLRLCNSSMFAGNVKIDSLNNALLLLGRGLFIKTIISASVDSFYNQIDSAYSLCKGGLYHHAVGTAIVSEKIASMTGKVSPSTAYTAGLLHDIGMVVLDQYMAPQCTLFYRELQHEENNMLATEKKLLGFDHCEVGKELAVLWNLPASLADTIYYHHFPERAANDIYLPLIVYLADLIMSRFNNNLAIERGDSAGLEARMNLLDMSLAMLPEIISRVPIEAFGATPELALARL